MGTETGYSLRSALQASLASRVSIQAVISGRGIPGGTSLWIRSFLLGLAIVPAVGGRAIWLAPSPW